MNVLNFRTAGNSPAANNVIPFPSQKRNPVPVKPGLLDLNEFVTGGKTGILTFSAEYNSEIFQIGDLVFVDSRRFDGALHYKNGQAVGTITHILRPIDNRDW